MVTSKDFFPRTINTAIQTSSDYGINNSTSGSTVNTTGSSNSNVNTFGGGLDIGMIGKTLSGSLSFHGSISRERGYFESSSFENSF